MSEEILKLVASLIVSEEHLIMVIPELERLLMIQLKVKYNYDILNRKQKNIIDSKIKSEIKDFRAKAFNLKSKLNQFTSKFSEDVKYYNIYDSTLDVFEIAFSLLIQSKQKLVVDPVKKELLKRISEIPSKERTEEEVLKITSSIDNFFTINKLK